MVDVDRWLKRVSWLMRGRSESWQHHTLPYSHYPCGLILDSMSQRPANSFASSINTHIGARRFTQKSTYLHTINLLPHVVQTLSRPPLILGLSKSSYSTEWKAAPQAIFPPPPPQQPRPDSCFLRKHVGDWKNLFSQRQAKSAPQEEHFPRPTAPILPYPLGPRQPPQPSTLNPAPCTLNPAP